MTPFGAKIRALRAERGVTLKDMAAALRVSPAYLSALEHGRRGRPSFAQVQAIIGFFNVIWDEAEEIEKLARLSHPRVTIDTSGLDPEATELANRLADEIAYLTKGELDQMLKSLPTRSHHSMHGSKPRKKR